MNDSFRTAFRVMCLSLVLALCVATFALSDGLLNEGGVSLAFNNVPARIQHPLYGARPVRQLASAQKPHSGQPSPANRAPVARRPAANTPVAVASREAVDRADDEHSLDESPRARPASPHVQTVRRERVLREPAEPEPNTRRTAARTPAREQAAATPRRSTGPRFAGVELSPAIEPQEEPALEAENAPEVRIGRVTPLDVSPLPQQPRTQQQIPVIDPTPLIEARLIRLQEQLEELARVDRTSEQLRRTTQLIAQVQQESQLQQLERALQLLQKLETEAAAPRLPTAAPAAATPAAPLAAPGPAAATAAPASTPQAERESGPAPEPLLKAEPATTSADGAERFSLQIKDAEITQVLDMLGQLAGMNIIATRNVAGKVTANLHDVTIEQALHAVLKAGGQTFERDGDLIFVMSAEEAQARKALNRRVVTKLYRPYYISAKDLQALLLPLLTPTIGKLTLTEANEIGLTVDNQVAGGDHLAQQDAVIVQDYPEILEEVDRLIAEMDVPPAQVVIEAMILRVRLTDTMAFGVNFALLNSGNNQLFVSGNGQVLESSTGFPGTPGAEIVPPLGQFVANTAGLKYGLIRGDVAMFIDALETLADTELIATPQLRALNKQKAELIIGQKLSYKTLAFNGNQTVENVNFQDAGTKLILRPFIAPDGLVRMEVHPERSSAVINAVTGLPDLSTTEVTTNIMVRDGMTAVIGGLIEEEMTESQQRIPFLGALPVVGPAFRNRTESIDRTELIVLITPRIVRELDSAIEGEAAKFENERRAEYFRDQLSPINRRNMSRMQLERARRCFEKGQYDRALRHIQHALHYNPNDREILAFRDRVEATMRKKQRSWFRLPGMSDPPVETTAEPVPDAVPPEPLPPPA